MENKQATCYDKFNCGKCEDRFGIHCSTPPSIENDEEEEEGQVEVETVTEKPKQCRKCQHYYCEICSIESRFYYEETLLLLRLRAVPMVPLFGRPEETYGRHENEGI